MRHACIAVNVQIHSEAAGSLRIIVHTTKGTADTVSFVVLLFFSMLPVGQIRRPCYKIRSFIRPPQDLFGGVQENRQRSRGQYRFFTFWNQKYGSNNGCHQLGGDNEKPDPVDFPNQEKSGQLLSGTGKYAGRTSAWR